MTPEDLAVAVLRSAAAALADRGIDEAIVPAATVVERPKNPAHGDYASSLALRLARQAGLPGTELAEAMAAYLSAASTDIERAEVAGMELGFDYDPQLLTHNREGDLLLALAQFPAVVASAADLRHPHRLARYLEDLAGTYHRFHDTCRILPRNGQPVSPVNLARLWLAEATRIVLANGLQLLGVSAPDRL
jgi:arginyl-tRNA synthetase